MAYEHVLESYKKFLICKDASAPTIEKYSRDIRKMLGYIKKKPKEIKQEDLDNYKIHLKEKYSQNTLTPKIAAINNFMKYLKKPFKLSAPAKVVKNKDPLTVDEVKRMFEFSKADSMDHALIKILYYTQLRRKEVENLNLIDIDWERQKIRVNKGKGNRYDVINVHPDALEAIKQYLPERKKPKTGYERALFINRYRTRIGKLGIHFAVKRVAANAGIKKRVYPHLFRISSITHMAENGATMPEIQKQSRHRDLDTLQGYIQISDEHAKKIYLRTIPKFDRETPEEKFPNGDMSNLLLKKLVSGEISNETFNNAIKILGNENRSQQTEIIGYS